MSVSAVSVTNCRYVPDAAIEMEEPKLKFSHHDETEEKETHRQPSIKCARVKPFTIQKNKVTFSKQERPSLIQLNGFLFWLFSWFTAELNSSELNSTQFNLFENKLWASVKIISFSLCPQCPHCDTMRNSTVSTVSQCPGPNTFLFHARWQRKAAWLRLMWPWKERWKIMMFCDVNSIPSRLIGWCNKLTHGVKL